MKKIFLCTAMLLAVLLLLPLTALNKTETQNLTSTQASAQLPEPLNSATFKVLISETNQVEEMSAKDYLFGVIAGEMPALYEEEALKAQAVCAYTFALWRQKANNDKPYDITDNFKTDQCYISREAALKKWGSNAEEYAKKIEKIINETENQMLTYNGDIILSVYHAVSGGSTESSKNVWGKDYPYLQSVDSVGDKLAKNYISEVTVDTAKLKTLLGADEISGNPFTDFARTEAGTVKTVKACGKEYKGSEIREMFDLKSSNFEAEFSDNKIIFTVYGYGHGVGMSQNGANYMAQQGSDYKEILKHYYKGCEIENIK
ncbi:MAG: stage II sporulation protein D [Clostridia bacterium]|nr:stage II sporulation protein D [Clostridia bacterium]